jgi:hypothetical protein
MRLVLLVLMLAGVGCGRPVDGTATPPTVPATASQHLDRDEITSNMLAQAREVGRATAAADYERLVDLMHPGGIRQAGGREKLIEYLRSTDAKIKLTGFRIATVDVGQPIGPTESGGSWYGLVPYEFDLADSVGVRGKLRSHNFGESRDGGRTWKFISADGVNGNRAVLNFMMPGYPDSLPVPPKGRTTRVDD